MVSNGHRAVDTNKTWCCAADIDSNYDDDYNHNYNKYNKYAVESEDARFINVYWKLRGRSTEWDEKIRIDGSPTGWGLDMGGGAYQSMGRNFLCPNVYVFLQAYGFHFTAVVIIIIIIYEFLVRLLQSEHRCIT